MKFKAPALVLAALCGFLAYMVDTPVAQARTINLVGFGDSLMAGYELPVEQAVPARLETLLKARGLDVIITNAGVSGDTSSDGLARLDWSIPDGTDGVILELGANDALRGLSAEETRNNIDAIMARLAERKIPVLLVGILAPPNMGADYEAAFNPIFPDLAKKHGVLFYPFFLDGVALDPSLKLKDNMHPNEKGTEVMAQKMAETVVAFLEKIENKQ